MGKNKNRAKGATPPAGNTAAPTVTVQGAPTTVTAGKATPGILTVHKTQLPLRGARAAWHAVLVAHNGQPVATFLAACAAAPPSVPKSGVVEKPQGWLRWFVRNGIASVAAAQQPATTVPTPAP